ncbi:MAG: IS5 family transposase [Cytophagales bacterium]|nr:IS5 family transposase [Cytophagales bacterium]
MKPKRINNLQENLFEPRISSIIDPKNPLKLLADQIDWTVFEKEFDRIYSKAKGQPPKPIRLMVGLFMLQHTTGVSEEQAVAIWAENPYWQYFGGYDYFCWKAPLDASTMVRWRQRLKASGMEKILQATITQAVQIGVAKQRDFKKVIVDTTVMEKHIAYPTDSKLLNRARQKLVTLAKRYGLQLRQNYNRVSSALVRKISGYAHAKQYKRMKRGVRQLKTYVGGVVREVERQLVKLPEQAVSVFTDLLGLSKRLLQQERHSTHKLYSMHEAHVYVVAKGKAHKRYEYGCQVSLAVTHKQGLVVSTQALSTNQYDGHSLSSSLKQAELLTGVPIEQAFVDKGYKGHGIEDKSVYLSPGKRNMTRSLKKAIRGRSAIEPLIGPMKNDGKLGLNYLKGVIGDELNAVLCAVGHNMRMILTNLQPL